MSVLSLDTVVKRYASTAALAEVSLQFNPGQITAVVGSSGCGKSTLLKICNGLVVPDDGRVEVFGEPIDYASLTGLRRRIGYAVQGNGLFPHLTAADNITLLARLAGWQSQDISQRIAGLLALTGLSPSLLEHYPHQLSGGQQQRVGLCRAMMMRPELLLLDEPFGALDPLTRRGVHQQLLQIHRAEPATTVLVTHDMQEAMLLADNIVVMRAGHVVEAQDKNTLLASHPGQAPEDILYQLLQEEST